MLLFTNYVLSPYKGAIILDFGCGGGDFLLEFSKRGFLAIGLEIVPRRAFIAKHKDFNSGSVEVIIGCCEAPPFRDNVFDAISCNQVLEHLNIPELGFRTIKNLLKPGCRALVSVPSWLEELRSRTFGNRLLQIGRALMHRALDDISYKNRPTILSILLFSKIDKLKRKSN